MNREKEEIVKWLATKPVNDIFQDAVIAYREKYPYDTDGMLLEGYCLLYSDLEKAEQVLKRTLKKQPYDADIWFLSGELQGKKGEYTSAVRNIVISYLLCLYYETESLFVNETICDQRMQELLDLAIADGASGKKGRYTLQMLQMDNQCDFYLFNDMIRLGECVIGSKRYFRDEMFYCGFANELVAFLEWDHESEKILMRNRGEILRVRKKGKELHVEVEGEALVPIASTEACNSIVFSGNAEFSVRVRQLTKEHFNYYRINQPVDIKADYDIIVGDIIPLKINPKNKKLIISLFVDGLSQQLLREEGISKIMPNTAHFFEYGVIAENVFTVSDWTYPSVAGIVSGEEVPDHMMFHPDINYYLPEDVPILFEVLEKAGYYTAMINGDWRICEPYGYSRGIFRSVLQNAIRLRVGDVVEEAVEHLTAFSGTNGYLWLSVGDLHDIADDFELPVSLQTKVNLSDRRCENLSVTSVKQEYSELKRNRYIESIKRVDAKLKTLYEFIEKNYKEDDFVFTLFSDHGQTYLNKPEDFHLSRNHANVAFMTRGGGISGRSEEYFSMTSYPAVLCQLAGINLEHTPYEEKLPVTFGGKKACDYTITETIHPGDSYMVSLHSWEQTFYLKTKEILTNYGKLPRGDYECRLLDSEGNLEEDDTKKEKYVTMLRERMKYLFEY